jgi:excinuclease ABC subunit A
MHPTLLSGARTHNLKNVDLKLTAGSVVAITGRSGSGKSSLALDTLYAEGQRRFVESFSPYARQFLERLERPPIDSLDPIAAGIAVDRKAPIKSSRSTLASMCDLTAYLAALFVREAVPMCPEHGKQAERLSTQQAASRLLDQHPGQRAVLTYPLRVDTTEEYLTLREGLIADGYRRLWLDSRARDLDSIRPSDALKGPALEVVIDRLKLDPSASDRLLGSIETAMRRGAGTALVHLDEGLQHLSDELSCPVCHKHLKPPQAGFFSFESPLGACPRCRGFGRTLGVSLEKVIPDARLSLADGAIRPWRGKSTTWERAELKKLCKRHNISFNKPWQSLTEPQKQLILEGDGDWDLGLFPGVLGWFRWLETRTYKMHVRVLLSRYRSYDLCTSCQGQRLSQASLSYTVGDLSLGQWHSLEVSEALERLQALPVATGQGKLIRTELLTRLLYLERVGLGYLSLDRQARTLSGGEAQRVTLTTALGTSLSNALFVLDEPSVGLHPSDIAPLNELIRELAQRSNIALVIEHDPLLIGAADRVIEMGPGAGETGGSIVFDGPPRAHSSGRSKTTRQRLSQFSGWLSVEGPSAHNLSFNRVKVPLGALVAITGPSGSGKSTLAEGIIYRGLARQLGDFDVEAPEAHAALVGGQDVEHVRLVDQSPLGRTSRGNAATYTKAWDVIRKRFSQTSEAKGKGLEASHFSFNVAGGRCDACDGEGFETVEMQFLADVHLPCAICKGQRFRPEVLAIQDRGHSVADVLKMSVEQALDSYRDERGVFRALAPVVELGLGYLRLGQSLSTLSGGEAQRLKLARALCHDKPKTLFVFDEPSAGLHGSEVELVVKALDLLVRSGSSVLVVEHDLSLIDSADYVIDLGPGGGRYGGKVVAVGSPSDLAKTDGKTARALSEYHKPSAKQKPRGRHKRAALPPPLELRITEAREHNLKELSVSIPHGKLSVVTGPSGSGKSTLAFDVIFAEGQRRFLETLTPYARQFLPSMARPDVSQVSGVPPAIALEQRTTRAGAKSTVATVTEVAHYLRLLYAKLGTAHCPDHGEPLQHLSAEEILEALRAMPGKLTLLAPAVEARKGVYLDLFTAAARASIEQALVDGKRAQTDDPPKLARQKEHDILLFIAGAVPGKSLDVELVKKALLWGKGALLVRRGDGGKLTRLSERASCSHCGLAIPELDPRFFSFNTKQGQCPRCAGDGVIEVVTKSRRKQVEASQYKPCPKCHGGRLSPLAAGVRLHGVSYPEFLVNSVDAAKKQIHGWKFYGAQQVVAKAALSELLRRLEFLSSVGLGYLGLDRAAATLSGGEMQRLRLAAQLGTGLTGALYVLDEPTIGLHPSDTERLLVNLRRLVDTGSSVLVVEHDADTIRAADYLIDLGPTGGAGGGHLMAAGTPEAVLSAANSPTARALAGPPLLRKARSVSKRTQYLELCGATQHNLRAVDIRVPLGHFSVVAGVSGSGKSTLVRSVLLPALRKSLGLVAPTPGSFTSLVGMSELKRAVAVDQSPIGRTPRSVPATFLGIWDQIRRLFAESTEAKVRGFDKGRFSFNAKGGGRCETCNGMGSITHEMSFLPDVTTPCPSCDGQRFEPRTLEVRYLGLSIGQVLALTAKQAANVFEHHPKIARPLATLSDLGADYVTLGQGSHTLSGGEAQRLKLAAELTQTERHEPTLYVLDEPTTGLHLADVAKLMDVLDRLVERGDTLVVIEHHPEVIAGADWLIELGPASGEQGGRVVAMGEPGRLLKKKTKTAHVLRGLLG